jgi:hypothetical protein
MEQTRTLFTSSGKGFVIGKLKGKQKIIQIYLIAMFRIIYKYTKLYLEITSKFKNIQSQFKQQNMFML